MTLQVFAEGKMEDMFSLLMRCQMKTKQGLSLGKQFKYLTYEKDVLSFLSLYSHPIFGHILHVLLLAPTQNGIYVLYQKGREYTVTCIIIILSMKCFSDIMPRYQ